MVSTKVTQHVEEAGMKPKAEYLIVLTWPDDRDVDLDLWLKTPDGKTINYASREMPNISLDRDSRGMSTNRSHLVNGTAVVSSNQEIIAIRAILPGEYIAAVNYYGGSADGHPTAVGYNIKVIKLNPLFTEVFKQDNHIDCYYESNELVHFKIDMDGTVTILPLSGEDIVGGGMMGVTPHVC